MSDMSDMYNTLNEIYLENTKDNIVELKARIKELEDKIRILEADKQNTKRQIDEISDTDDKYIISDTNKIHRSQSYQNPLQNEVNSKSIQVDIQSESVKK
jgi:predicted  nucleic acid-binding Zn-ribbon protein